MFETVVADVTIDTSNVDESALVNLSVLLAAVYVPEATDVLALNATSNVVESSLVKVNVLLAAANAAEDVCDPISTVVVEASSLVNVIVLFVEFFVFIFSYFK